MKKWADYLISEVSYDSEYLISVATRHQDTAKGITSGKPVDRLTIASDIKNGLLYITIYSKKNSWTPGNKLKTFSIGGTPYLRIDGNKVKLDYLGDLPESSFVKSVLTSELDLAPEPVTETEPPSSPRGSLPKDSAEELPQELDLAPEPVTETEEEATPEQLARLEQLTKQIQELESQPEPVTETEEEATPEQLSHVDDLQRQIDDLEHALSTQKLPESKLEEEEATPEQLSHVDDLQRQIDDLEHALSTQKLPESKLEEEEATPEQLSHVDDLQRQIDDLEHALSTQKLPESKLEEEEATPEQLSKVKELEKEIEKLEAVDVEHEIIQTLRKQNKKLDDIENNLHNFDAPKVISQESSNQTAYCVRCKTKRIIKNPEETIMKNGRPAIKGICSTCECKVFRIGKMKK